MPLSEADVFSACATDKKRLTRWDERKYKEVWLAFCKWIVERFDKGKGVNVVYLMRLTWTRDEMEKEMYGSTNSDVVLRPVWRLAEGFEKANRLQLRNKNDKCTTEDDRMMAKSEEVNFHKLAMRYSTSLSKDCVFSCLRQIILFMGNMMAKGMDLRVFCGVGDLCCRDKKVHFEFDSHYHRFVMRRNDWQPSISIKSIMEEVDQLEAGSAVRNREVLEINPDGEEEEEDTFDGVLNEEEGNGAAERPEEEEEEVELDDEGNPLPPRARTAATSRAVTAASFRLSSRAASRRATRSATPIKHSTLAPIWNGAQNEDVGVLRKVQAQEGKNKLVRDMMWDFNRKKMEHESQFETRNLLLGEQRRQMAEEEDKKRLLSKQQYSLSLAGTQKAEANMRDERRRQERSRRMAEAAEDPFYVHLEPDPTEVHKKKLKEQASFRESLEQQIATRIKTATSFRSSDRKFDRQSIADDQAGLLASLQELTVRKSLRDRQLKLEWSRQVEARNAAKKMETSINRCFTLPDTAKEQLRKSVPFLPPRRPSTSVATPPQYRSVESLRQSSQAGTRKKR